MASDREAFDKLSTGRQRMQLGDFEGALKYFDEVIALDPTHMTLTSAHGNRAAALRQLGRHQEAADSEDRWESQKQASMLRQASSSIEAPKRTTASADTERRERATASTTNGVALLRAGNYEEAIQAFTRYIDSHPNEPSGYRNRAKALEALGRLEKAQADLVTSQSLVDRDRGSESEDGGGHIIFGMLLLGGGAIATVVTYAMAAPGGTYFVFWGAMLWGGIEVVRGMAKG